MRRRSIQVLLFVAAAAVLSVAPIAQAPAMLTVHEWGTFTSVAGSDGQAVPWVPQGGTSDLPCFVERDWLQIKGLLRGTIRMETPVLYFYAPRPTDVSVDVKFPQGVVTEWYPRATVTRSGTSNGAIAWPFVSVTPGSADAWPRETRASHYYAARETGADPVRIGSQTEKFLFYRGIGQFQPPLSAIAQPDGGVALRSTGDTPLGDVILFENRRGAMTFTSHHFTGSTAQLPRPDLDDASGAPLAELKQILVAHGLFEAEAQAMVNTWKDSWFEEGSRLLYIVPAARVDAILPLKISPAPSAVARVFVGRIELVTPATLRDVKAAIESGDRAALAKYGRFLEPIAERAGVRNAPLVTSLASESYTAAFSCR